MSPEEEVHQVASRLDEVAAQLEEVAERVSDVEEAQNRIEALPSAVSELKGMVTILQTAVTNGFDGVQKPLQAAADSSSVKNAVQFAAVVLVPLLVALIGAYVAIKTGSK